MNEKIYPHKLIVNEYLTVDLQIPEVLDASELQGLMKMVAKIVNINHIPSTEIRINKPNRGKTQIHWTEEMINRAIELWDTNNSKTSNLKLISKEMGVSYNSVMGRYYKEKNEGNDWEEMK